MLICWLSSTCTAHCANYVCIWGLALRCNVDFVNSVCVQVVDIPAGAKLTECALLAIYIYMRVTPHCAKSTYWTLHTLIMAYCFNVEGWLNELCMFQWQEWPQGAKLIALNSVGFAYGFPQYSKLFKWGISTMLTYFRVQTWLNATLFLVWGCHIVCKQVDWLTCKWLGQAISLDVQSWLCDFVSLL